MEMHERIKKLRKDYLKLSQTEFGHKLGVSRSVINNIERNVLVNTGHKLSLIKLICKEFSVNEEWLLNGTDPMFVQPDTFSFDEFAKMRNATDLELKIMRTYLELDENIREQLIEHFKRHFLNTPSEESALPEPPSNVLETPTAHNAPVEQTVSLDAIFDEEPDEETEREIEEYRKYLLAKKKVRENSSGSGIS